MLYNNVLGIYDETAGTFRISEVNPADGDWHHLVVTFQSGVANGTTIYFDGRPVAVTTMTVVTQSQPLYISGSTLGGGSEYVAGLIDEVAVYNTILSPTTITDHHNSGTGTTTTTTTDKRY